MNKLYTYQVNIFVTYNVEIEAENDSDAKDLIDEELTPIGNDSVLDGIIKGYIRTSDKSVNSVSVDLLRVDDFEEN